MSALDRTLDQYQELMRINAVSHLLRTGSEIGIYDALRDGQQTAEQLCQSMSLQEDSAKLLFDALVAIGIIEQYGDDYALSQAARLLCQYDDDLGDRRWQRLGEVCQGKRERAPSGDQPYFDHLAATQWVHTPAAMEAAEILDIGGEGEIAGPRILDLGCGSAVWSCAMAHRDAAASLVLVDRPGELEAARKTAESIAIADRVETIEGDPDKVGVEGEAFDIVLIAQRLSGLGDAEAKAFLTRGLDALRPGGRLVIIDAFRGPTRPPLAECVEALILHLESRQGGMRTLDEMKEMLESLQLTDVQFALMAASRANFGLAVVVKNDPDAAPSTESDTEASEG